MGLFFNYNKQGPGVEKDEPRRKGVGLYLELLWRSFGKLMLANIIYFATSLPILVLYFVVILQFLQMAIPEAIGTISLFQSSLIITLITAILWGTGPVSMGYTYILRNTAREEHSFTCSDFFEKSRESFRRGLIFLGVDVLMLLGSGTAIVMYRDLAERTGGVYTILLFVAYVTLFFYTIMHFYMYEFEVTFKNSILEVYKNSLIMAFATLPMCVLLTLIIYFGTTILLGFLNTTIVLIIAALLWISVMRFAIDFYTARAIKSKILSRYEDK